jgi:arylsulfatase A-like enzyme
MKEEEKKNIVLIGIDALRADHLGGYAYNKETSPNIDSLVKKGTTFENAFSCINTTDPSFTTMLSGKYPISHGIINHSEKVTKSMLQNFYKRKVEFLSEILRDNGYKTIGIDWLGRWHKKGFEYYLGDAMQKKHLKILSKIVNLLPNTFSEKIKKIYRRARSSNSSIYTATKLTDKALELIDNCNKPFFLFIHYWDTHTPYSAPESIYNEFKPEGNGKELEELFANIRNEKWKEYLLKAAGKATTAEEVSAMYDSAIKYVDQEIGRLVKYFKEEGIYENTIFVITSDHGESLIEHGIFFDHHGLYDESIHVPLIFNNLPVEEKRIKDFVQHVDIVPTLLDILNIPFEESKFDGVSLVPLIRGKVNTIRSFIVAEESYTEKKIAIRTNKWKYIYSPSKEAATCSYCGVIHGGIEELYHLESDPKEMRNIVEEKPEIAKMLRKNLFSWLSNLKSKEEKKLISQRLSKLKKNGEI